MSLSPYLPQDRLHALARGEPLPDRTTGSALFADISGFTPLTEKLTQTLGPRRGIEDLTRQINAVYERLIAEVERYGGSVIGFAGDAITCWFDDMTEDGGPRTGQNVSSVPRPRSSVLAVSTAFALQTAMRQFPDLGLKVAVTTGTARRFAVGNPEDQYWDTLAGHTISRLATAEHLANRGDIVVDEPTYQTIADHAQVGEWRTEADERFAVLATFTSVISPVPSLPPDTISPDLLCPWINPAVFAREQAGQGVFLTELRPATTLFLRFMGIDFEAEQAGSQLDAFLHRVQAVLQRYEGTLIQLTIGDKGSYLYAAFGAPVAHEDDSRRAVKAAVDLRNAAQEMSFLTPVQIGLTRGTMRTGAYGGPTRRTYGVLGDEVNLAARLMTLAAPGQILVSERVQKATAHTFTFETLPPVRVKGKTDLLPIFAVLRAHAPHALRLQEPTYALPMVGRTTELQTIAGTLDQTLQGHGQVIGIFAEAGMGKSRLAAEAIRLAREKGFIGYGGAAQADGVQTPYLAWRPVWAAFFELNSTAPQPEQIQALEDELRTRVPERLEALPLLGPLLNLDLPENAFTLALEPKYRQSALRALLEDCLRAAAREAPLLIVLEDLHWLDALSLTILDELALALRDSRVCFVLAYRPQPLAQVTPRFQTLPNFTQLELTELTPAEATQALHAKLAQLYPARDGQLPAVWVERLHARAQGNPFYLEELLNYLHARGLDPFDPAALAKVELPDSLHTLILSRIDQLTEAEKTTLRVASIIGRLFRAAWLTGYYPELGELPTVKLALDQLADLDLTPLDAPEPELAYLFKHIITHEVTYESLPYATRAHLHEQLAHYLEYTYPDHPPVEVLAFHYGHSENTAKQREYFRKAGDAAQRNYANTAALDFYSKLLPLLEDAQEQAQVRWQKGQVLNLLGRWDEAEEDFRAVLGLSEDNLALRADAQFAMGNLTRQRSDFQVALTWLAEAKANRTALADTSGLMHVILETGATFLNMHLAREKGAAESAQVLLEEGLALARQQDDKPSMAYALNHLGSLAGMKGDYATVEVLYQESMAIRRELGDKKGLAVMLGNLGNIAKKQGDFLKARGLYLECSRLFREVGEKRSIAMVLINLGLLTFEQGDYAHAQALCEESLTLFREMGDKQTIAFALMGLGDVLAIQGNYAAARVAFEESLGLGANFSYYPLGRVVLAQGEYALAQTNFEKSLEFSRGTNAKKSIVLSLIGLGHLALVQNNATAAREWFEEALALNKENESKANLAATLLGLGLLALAEKNGEAYPHMLESLRLYQETESRPQQTSSLLGVAGVVFQRGDARRAAQLLGAVETALKALTIVIEPEMFHFHAQLMEKVRTGLGESAFQAAWNEGSQWSLEEAVRFALAEETK